MFGRKIIGRKEKRIISLKSEIKNNIIEMKNLVKNDKIEEIKLLKLENLEKEKLKKQLYFMNFLDVFEQFLFKISYKLIDYILQMVGEVIKKEEKLKYSESISIDEKLDWIERLVLILVNFYRKIEDLWLKKKNNEKLIEVLKILQKMMINYCELFKIKDFTLKKDFIKKYPKYTIYLKKIDFDYVYGE